MAYTWDNFYDPNNLFVIIIASVTILYGSYRSRKFFESYKESLELEQSTVQMKTAIIMPIVGSIFLVLLFFLLKKLVYLLIGVMALASLAGFSFFVWPFIDAVFQQIGWNKNWDVKWIGDVTPSGLVSLAVALGVVIAWLITYEWFLIDLLAISLAISALSFVRLPNLKVATFVLTAFFLYDIFWVFISPIFFKTSVMVKVATSLPALTMVIVIPKISSHGGYTLLGLGDIVLPGLWLCFLYRFDSMKQIAFKNGYFLVCWIAYMLGMVLTFAMLVVLQMGQPALLYLVPFTLIPAIGLAYFRGHLGDMWRGVSPEPLEDDSERLIPDNSLNSV